MAENILFRFVRGQVEAATETVEVWKAEHHEAMRARDADDIARYLLDLPATVKRTCRSLLDEERAQEEADPNGVREKIQMILDKSLGLLRAHREHMRSFENAGHAMELSAELDKAIAGLEEFRQGLLQHWPVFTQQDLDEGWASHLRGEGLPPDEAFAEITGMSKDAWHKKVEAYRRQRGRQ